MNENMAICSVFWSKGTLVIILKSQGLTGMESPESRRANFHNNPMTCVKVKGHDVIRMNTLTRQPLRGGGGDAGDSN